MVTEEIEKKKPGSNLRFIRKSSARSSDRAMTVGADVSDSERLMPGVGSNGELGNKKFKYSKFSNIPLLDANDLSSSSSSQSSKSESDLI